jgi:hypothetical protein
VVPAIFLYSKESLREGIDMKQSKLRDLFTSPKSNDDEENAVAIKRIEDAMISLKDQLAAEAQKTEWINNKQIKREIIMDSHFKILEVQNTIDYEVGVYLPAGTVEMLCENPGINIVIKSL